VISKTTLSRPVASNLDPTRRPPIFSTARWERMLRGPTRKTTRSTKPKA
jgi:hypothetical protein